MNKQSKALYGALINRIAICMLLNQAIFAVLSAVTTLLGIHFRALYPDSQTVDIITRFGECVTYFLGFTLPVLAFNRMNNSAELEIYEPVRDESAKFTRAETFFSVGIALGATSAAAILNYYVVGLFGNYSDFSEEYLWSTDLSETYMVVIYFIYVAIIPAIVEELLFRGTVCRALRAYGGVSAAVISAVLFSLMHANVEQIIYTFVAGLALAWIYLRTEKIIYPIAVHCINNAVSALGDIVEARCSEEVYERFVFVSESITWIFVGASVLFFAVRLARGKRSLRGVLGGKIEMKPDENGNEVLPLGTLDKVRGFFGVGMIFFIIYSVLTMAYYVFLSTLV